MTISRKHRFKKQSYSGKVCSAVCIWWLASAFLKGSGSVSDGLWGEVLVTDRGSELEVTCWMKSPSHLDYQAQQAAGRQKLSHLTASCDSLDPKQCKLMRFDLKSDAVYQRRKKHIHLNQIHQGINICSVLWWLNPASWIPLEIL